MSLFTSLRTANNALNAASIAIRTTGHNIANAGNEDYNRQRVKMAALPPSPDSNFFVGTGVEVARLEATDAALSDAARLLSRAREILSAESNSGVTGTRDRAAAEVEQLIFEGIEIANRQFNGRYLLAGDDGSRPPAEIVGGLVNFIGSSIPNTVRVSNGVTLQRNVTGEDAFGALSTEIIGDSDLNPALSIDTKLDDLNGGIGVLKGSIMIEDGLGGGSMIDLSLAESVGDIIDLINAEGMATATISPGGDALEISTSGGSLSVLEVNGGKGASSLGILQSVPGTTFVGSDVDPRIQLTTALATLNAGAGVDPAGLTIMNDLVTKTISFAGASSVEDIINIINGSDAYVRASIKEDGTGLDIQSTPSGSRFSVAENGGTTAVGLGWDIPFPELPVTQLNNGFGVFVVPGADFQITARDGTTMDVDISNAKTVQDILDIVNTHVNNGGKVTARIVAGQNQIEFEDNTGGTADFIVAAMNGSFSAQNLGIDQEVQGTVITGGDLNPAGIQVDSFFNMLVLLRDALREDNDSKIEQIGSALDRSEDRVLDVRGEIGARINRLELTKNRIAEQGGRLQTLISDELEVDLADAVVEFEKQRNILQASLSVTARILSLSLLDFLR